jgi:hypothetical protein
LRDQVEDYRLKALDAKAAESNDSSTHKAA